MIWKLFLTISLSALLIACAPQRVQPIEDVRWETKWRTYDCGIPPARDPIHFRRFTWWTTEEGDYVLSSDEYGSLGENMQEISKGAKQLKAVISFYVECIAAAQLVEEAESIDS